MNASEKLPIVVIGAGPVGLAAAAHLLDRGIEPLVLEAGDTVGANLLDYGHVQLFSPWRYCLDMPMVKRLARQGWEEPDLDELPLARDVVEKVLKPFAALPEIAPSVRLRHRVLRVSREGYDKVKTEGRDTAPFVVRVTSAEGPMEVRARAVIDSSGTWSTPNPLGASGLPAIGEEEAAAHIHYGIPDILNAARKRYAGRRVMVVGAGHSAANALLALAELVEQGEQVELIWAVRSKSVTRVFGGGTADALPARGQLGTKLRKLKESGRLDLVTDFRIVAVSRRAGKLVVHATDTAGTKKCVEEVDEIICATGQRPDLAMTGELRVRLDPWLESTEALGPLIDPNVHSCGTVRPHGHRELAHPEPDFYTIGVKSYGRAPTFLMATGYEQARSVVAALAGDIEAADRVQLVLPETGVCSSDLGDEGRGCCSTGSPKSAALEVPALVPAGADCGSPERAEPARKPVKIPVKSRACCG